MVHADNMHSDVKLTVKYKHALLIPFNYWNSHYYSNRTLVIRWKLFPYIIILVLHKHLLIS